MSFLWWLFLFCKLARHLESLRSPRTIWRTLPLPRLDSRFSRRRDHAEVFTETTFLRTSVFLLRDHFQRFIHRNWNLMTEILWHVPCPELATWC